ncbi:MAG: hypothetical protein L3J32_08815 [Rhizobiaceae bacterium]|nr:hypothetical protein [Rhizobiaceae bacterium]
MADPISRIKAFFLRLTCPLFFKRIGKGCKFQGRVRLPRLLRNVTIGDQCMIGESVLFHTSRQSNITLGNNSRINTGCHLVASERISIGDNVAIGEYSTLRDQEHRFNQDIGIDWENETVEPITIHDNVWIGRGVYIGPGTTIGSGCIIGANSVVNGKFPENALIAGAPAVIKKRLG